MHKKLSPEKLALIENRRRQAGYTQAEVANLMHMSQGGYCQKSSGRYCEQVFSLEQILMLCGILNMHPERDLGIQLPGIRDLHYEYFYVLLLALNGRKLSKIGVTNDPVRRFSEHEDDYAGFLPNMIMVVHSTVRGFCLSLESQLLAVHSDTKKSVPKSLGSEVLGLDPAEVIEDVLDLTNVNPSLHDVTLFETSELTSVVRPDRHKLQSLS